jgi:hypothetical protein
MQALSFRLLGRVAFFSVVGALLGFIDWLCQDAFFSATDSLPLLAPLLVLAPCLTAIAALPPWGFKVLETYWKAPLLCAIAFIAWTLLRHYLLFLIPTDASGYLFWEALEFWIDGVVKVFAMFAYIIRAVVVRASQRMAIIFVVLGAATNLIYLSNNPLQIGMWLVCQYSFLLGVSALAAQVFSRKRARPLLKTLVEEAR